ncbi:MAG: hypothetical protein ACOYOP_08495 [Microthrixaceae bacterium]
MLASIAASSPLVLAAEGDGQLFLGPNFFPLMILAFGAAMVVGNVLALVRPPKEGGERPSVARVGVLILIGVVAAGWGIASLV